MRKNEKETSAFVRFLRFISGWSNPALYGATISLILSLYFALFKVGDIEKLPKLLQFVSMQFTPWFMVGYQVVRRIIPDINPRRVGNLFLPIVEGLLATGFVAALFSLGFELADPYANVGLLAGQLLLAIVGARMCVRRVFRH